MRRDRGRRRMSLVTMWALDAVEQVLVVMLTIMCADLIALL